MPQTAFFFLTSKASLDKLLFLSLMDSPNLETNFFGLKITIMVNYLTPQSWQMR